MPPASLPSHQASRRPRRNDVTHALENGITSAACAASLHFMTSLILKTEFGVTAMNFCHFCEVLVIAIVKCRSCNASIDQLHSSTATRKYMRAERIGNFDIFDDFPPNMTSYLGVRSSEWVIQGGAA